MKGLAFLFFALALIGLMIHHFRHDNGDVPVLEFYQAKASVVLCAADAFAKGVSRRMLRDGNITNLDSTIQYIVRMSDSELFSEMNSCEKNHLNPKGINQHQILKLLSGPAMNDLIQMSRVIPWKTLLIGNLVILSKEAVVNEGVGEMKSVK
jgi:hypothetical protein